MIRMILESCDGALISISGKFTAPRVDPVLINLTRALPTSIPIEDWASSVDPPMCGVKMVFGQPIKGVSKPGPFLKGSVGYTSTAAPDK